MLTRLGPSNGSLEIDRLTRRIVSTLLHRMGVHAQVRLSYFNNLAPICPRLDQE